MLTCCPLSTPCKALLNSCWAPSVGKPPWEPWAAAPQAASRGQLLRRARCFKVLLMFSCLTSRCVALASIKVSICVSFSFPLFFLNNWNTFKIYIKKCIFYLQEPCAFLCQSSPVPSIPCPCLHAPVPGSPFSRASVWFLLLGSWIAQAQPVCISPCHLQPPASLAPLSRFHTVVPQSCQLHQFYMIWVHMNLYEKMVPLLLKRILKSVDLLFICYIPL